MPPDPARQNLAGRVFETLDLVQVVVVEPKPNRLAGFPDVGKVDDPAELGIRLAFDIDPNAERMAVEAFALVPLGYVRKQVRSLEAELSPDLHANRSLCRPVGRCQCP